MSFFTVALRLLLLVSMPSIFDEGADALQLDGAFVTDELDGAFVTDECMLSSANCH